MFVQPSAICLVTHRYWNAFSKATNDLLIVKSSSHNRSDLTPHHRLVANLLSETPSSLAPFFWAQLPLGKSSSWVSYRHLNLSTLNQNLNSTRSLLCSSSCVVSQQKVPPSTRITKGETLDSSWIPLLPPTPCLSHSLSCSESCLFLSAVMPISSYYHCTDLGQVLTAPHQGLHGSFMVS